MLLGGTICDGSECTELVLVIIGIVAGLALAAVLCFLGTWYGATGAFRRRGVESPRAIGFAVAAALAIALGVAISQIGAGRLWWLALGGAAWGVYERAARS